MNVIFNYGKWAIIHPGPPPIANANIHPRTQHHRIFYIGKTRMHAAIYLYLRLVRYTEYFTWRIPSSHSPLLYPNFPPSSYLCNRCCQLDFLTRVLDVPHLFENTHFPSRCLKKGFRLTSDIFRTLYMYVWTPTFFHWPFSTMFFFYLFLFGASTRDDEQSTPSRPVQTQPSSSLFALTK